MAAPRGNRYTDWERLAFLAISGCSTRNADTEFIASLFDGKLCGRALRNWPKKLEGDLERFMADDKFKAEMLAKAESIFAKALDVLNSKLDSDQNKMTLRDIATTADILHRMGRLMNGEATAITERRQVQSAETSLRDKLTKLRNNSPITPEELAESETDQVHARLSSLDIEK